MSILEENKENHPIMDQDFNSPAVEDQKFTRQDSFESTPSKTRTPLVQSNNISPSKQQLDIKSQSNNLSAFSSPRRPGTTTSSTRVIEALHKEIDELKSERIKLKSNNDELKKSHDLVKKRRDQIMEQLSNSKHENETVNSLLQRKQRRINDLENQLNETSGSNDDLKFKFQQLEVRCEKIRESEATSVAEFERLKIAYDTIVTSQKEYREYYNKEIKTLKDRLSEFIAKKEEHISKNITLITKSDSTIGRSLKSVNNRSAELEQLYQDRDRKLASKLEKVTNANNKQNRDVSKLIELSKELFHEVAISCQINKEELLNNYLAGDETRTDPFKENVENEEVSEQNEQTDQQQQPQQQKPAPYRPPSHRKTPSQQINIKKRNERKTASRSPSNSSTNTERNSSVEERVLSLDKELNKSIPLKDRITPNAGTLNRSKSVKGHQRNNSNTSRIPTSDSRRSSRYFESDYDRNQTTRSTSHSRRSSRIFDDKSIRSNNSTKRQSKIFDFDTPLNSAGFPKSPDTAMTTTSESISTVNSIPNPSPIDPTSTSTEGVVEQPKRKRRRRRRRRGKKSGANQNSEGTHSDENDESDDDQDLSYIESDNDLSAHKPESSYIEKAKDNSDADKKTLDTPNSKEKEVNTESEQIVGTIKEEPEEEKKQDVEEQKEEDVKSEDKSDQKTTEAQ
ncbi:hypothetical protein BN7_1732 [Wickerhamomyces ciferrii]|uniref:SWI5-dependent HO expression protein 3 n=1 Tax=Wickerhamomyces ciferrii (strain ATCC 14091 / BCRC 22168 / CBS 111 / JCM 3599 / NBRC 0793 / NRRL Y-1031 F-60-10) TaxID=1206466 RepID=K0KM36_WICCF|nr:uncharacterized protein BN7_1732 [Wickerhamomyces ciferrii]CCH42188.1 hypothetical protein BN7_1732 [Wickerhamomyces ciferrii]